MPEDGWYESESSLGLEGIISRLHSKGHQGTGQISTPGFVTDECRRKRAVRAVTIVGGKRSILQFDPGAQSSGSRFATIDLVPVSGIELPSARKDQVFCQDLLTDPFGPVRLPLHRPPTFDSRDLRANPSPSAI